MALGVSDVAALRANLSAAGYTWLALYNPDQEQTTTGEPIAEKSRGKVPMAAKWQQGGPQPLDVRALNTGILATGLQAIDIDIDDPELARTIRDMAAARWGEAPLRSRGSGPRCLMLCRAPPGMQPAKRSVRRPVGQGRGSRPRAAIPRRSASTTPARRWNGCRRRRATSPSISSRLPSTRMSPNSCARWRRCWARHPKPPSLTTN